MRLRSHWRPNGIDGNLQLPAGESDANADGNANAQWNANAHAIGDTIAYAFTNSHCKTDSNTQASANPAPETVADNERFASVGEGVSFPYRGL
jgi:hypothetical protein